MHLHLMKNAVVVIALHITAGAAFAQFAWIDSKGVRQYSDQPPPAATPKNRILKEPGPALRESQKDTPAADAAGAAGAGGAAGTVAAAPKMPMTTAEKEADFVKRKSDQAEKERKAAEDMKLAAAKTKNCDLAQSYGRALQSGERITTTDKNGERSFLSDEKRAQEIAENRRSLDACK